MADNAAKRQELDVFAEMRDFERQLAAIRFEAKRPIVYPITRNDAMWLCDRLTAVLAAIQDGHVTYGYVGEGGANGTPMHVERDAIVRALYTGVHDARP